MFHMSPVISVELNTIVMGTFVSFQTSDKEFLGTCECELLCNSVIVGNPIQILIYNTVEIQKFVSHLQKVEPEIH